MTGHPRAEIDLRQLTAVSPFVVATDEQLTVRWASEPVLSRAGKVPGLNISDIIRPVEPLDRVTRSSIVRNIQVQHRFLLKTAKGWIPLTGRWLSSDRGFVLLGAPDVTKSEDLHEFSFEDFPDEDPTIELITTREEYMTSLNEAKSAADALREARGHLDAIFATMAEGLIVLSPEGRIVKANPAAARILGRSHAEIQRGMCNVSMWEVVKSDGTAMAPDEMPGVRAIREGRVVRNVEMGVKRLDGTTAWTSVSAAPLRGKDALPTSVVASLVDITDRKEAEEDMKRMNRLMTGREERVIEMKREVNSLLAELGRKPRYRSVLEGDEAVTWFNDARGASGDPQLAGRQE